MKRILDLIADEMKSAFTACGYDASYAKVSFKNEKIDWSRCSHTDLIINMLKKEAKR